MKMKLKKISLVLFILVLIGFSSGCVREEKTTDNNSGTTKQEIVASDFDEDGSGELRCSQEVDAEEGIDVDLRYIIEYKRGNIIKLRSISTVTSSDSEKLDTYENAYEKIATNYNDLANYQTNIIRDSNSVMYDAIINYDKIDIDKLLEIEGEEDNIIVGNKAKLSLWLELAGKVGTVCEEV